MTEQNIDEADFMKLFLKHENALRAFARSLLPDWSSVDDVLQDASVVMWKKLNQVENEDGFLPWGKVIVRFKCLNYLQKKKADKFVFSEKVLTLIADDAEKIPAGVHSWRRKAMECCLENFSDSQKELLLSQYIQHGSITVLAEQQKVSVNSLYKKLGRLREKLFNCIRSRKEEFA